jgi:hypothetical protein
LPECSTVFRHGLFDARQRLTAPWCGTTTWHIGAPFDTFLCIYTRKRYILIYYFLSFLVFTLSLVYIR